MRSCTFEDDKRVREKLGHSLVICAKKSRVALPMKIDIAVPIRTFLMIIFASKTLILIFSPAICELKASNKNHLQEGQTKRKKRIEHFLSGNGGGNSHEDDKNGIGKILIVVSDTF